jgi:hypothetical protein
MNRLLKTTCLPILIIGLTALKSIASDTPSTPVLIENEITVVEGHISEARALASEQNKLVHVHLYATREDAPPQRTSK